MRELFIVLVLLAVSLVVVKYKKRKLEEPRKTLKKGRSSNSNNNNKMVKCLHCGLHIPEEEAIKKGDKVFCSLEHAGREI